MVSFPFPFPGIRNSFYSETLHTNFLSFIQQNLFLGYALPRTRSISSAIFNLPPQSSYRVMLPSAGIGYQGSGVRSTAGVGGP